MSLRLVLPLLAILTLVIAPIVPIAAEEPTVESAKKDAHTIRIVRPKGAYADHPTAMGFDPMSLVLGGGGPQKSFPALCKRLLELAEDDEIDTILFDLSSPFGMNLPQLTELRRVIAQVRAKGKSTIAWIENGANLQLGLASACDRILMADFGTLDTPSLAMSSMHFKDAMDLFGVEASVARVGDFKGAVEPYTRSEISDHLKGHYKKMLRTMNDEVVRWIVDGRGMTTSEVRGVQSDRIFTATGALERGLVDSLVPYGKLYEMLESEYEEGVRWLRPQKKYQAPPNFFELFAEMFGATPEKPAAEPSLAILHLDGQIIDGQSAVSGSMVSGPTVRSIRRLTEDDQIKGVVVRINSPGGSATASEAIRQGLMELSAKKPVVFSMGNVAASGGYWITCLGRPIYAESATITGSIGVFAMKLSFGGLMSRVGVRVTPITLDDSAGAMDISRGWTPKETKRIELLIGEVYDRFLDVVSDSREMERDKVAKLAGGRVWSGAQALENGLVDGIGGMDTALNHIANEAGLSDGEFAIIHRPDEQNPLAGLDLFGTGGGGDEIRSALPLGALRLLKEAGFDVLGYLRAALDASSDGELKVMMLAPDQIIVK